MGRADIKSAFLGLRAVAVNGVDVPDTIGYVDWMQV